MPRPPHWLAPAGATSTPPLVVSFDTETVSAKRGRDEVLTLRCWDAIVRHRFTSDLVTPGTVHRHGETAGQLAALLEGCTGLLGECWAFAHNVGFDLTVTSLPMILGERGWDADFVSLGDEATVFVLKRDGEKLVITDSWSWLRSPLSAAAKDVGMRQMRRPPAGGDLKAWHRRCRHDVEILDRAIATLLDWWDDQDLGGFGITGSACGWRAMRALAPPKSILVGADGERTVFERRAVYSGRKEVWQVGRVRHRWVADYDLANAHLTIAAHLPLPVVPLRPHRLALIADPLSPPEGIGTICEVDVTTSEPCAPVKIGDDVWWPRGRFRTVLTSAELAEVCRVAERVDVLQARWYRLGTPLQPWGRWCLDLLDDADRTVPPIVKRVAKGWGRSVPGRFALRVATLLHERPATHLGWALEAGRDLDTGEALEAITWGGVERTYRKDQDGADVFPAVLAFVEGYLRAAIAAALAERDPQRLLQVNTDGWWEVCRDARETIDPNDAPWPFKVVRRSHERGVNIIGPNHTVTAGDRRLSGVPKDAKEADDGAFVWQDWPGLRWQLENSRPGEYVRPRRGITLQPHYCRRWVLEDGETVAAATTLTPEGETVFLPWPLTPGRYDGDRLAAVQVPALEGLRDGPELVGSSPRAAAPRPNGRR